MSGKDIVKLIGGSVVAAGAGLIVKNIAKFTTPLSTGPVKKVLITIGAVTIGWYIGDKVATYMMDEFEAVVTLTKEVIDLIKAEASKYETQAN